MNDEYFERLRAHDPASPEAPDLASIKARIDVHTADNVVSFTTGRQFTRGLRIAAAVGALALAGGVGFAGGTLRTNAVSNTESLTTLSGASATVTAQDASRNAAPAAGAAVDSKMASSYIGGGYWGSAILKPTSTVPNIAGTAPSYAYRVGDVDKFALANALAAAVGLEGVKATAVGNGAVQVSNDLDGGYSVYVGDDAMMWFSGYNNTESPWFCDGMKTGSGTSGKEITAEQQQAAQTACDAEWPTPSKADAIAAAKKVVAALGLDVTRTAKYSAYSYSTRSMTVVVTPVIDGMEIGNTWQVEVSKNGVFTINGYAATPVKAQSYPVVGARDAALRSELRKWQAFGPQQVFDADAQMTTNSGPAVFGTPTVRTKDGKPMPQGYITEVAVQSAEMGLMQVNLVDGTTMMLPAWTFTAADGSRWQMLAIAEAYIDWESQPASGPIAYDARSSAGSEGVAPAVASAPMMK